MPPAPRKAHNPAKRSARTLLSGDLGTTRRLSPVNRPSPNSTAALMSAAVLVCSTSSHLRRWKGGADQLWYIQLCGAQPDMATIAAMYKEGKAKKTMPKNIYQQQRTRSLG